MKAILTPGMRAIEMALASAWLLATNGGAGFGRSPSAYVRGDLREADRKSLNGIYPAEVSRSV